MEEIKLFVQQARKNRQRIVLATGVFDILHQEHQKFLAKAKKAGDVLIVGIESDDRVKKIKGADRPTNNEKERLKKLQLFSDIDLVFILPEKFSTTQEHLALLKLIQPQILAVSSHTPFLDQKRKLIQLVGGELKIVHQFNPKISTSNFLTQINKKK